MRVALTAIRVHWLCHSGCRYSKRGRIHIWVFPIDIVVEGFKYAWRNHDWEQLKSSTHFVVPKLIVSRFHHAKQKRGHLGSSPVPICGKFGKWNQKCNLSISLLWKGSIQYIEMSSTETSWRLDTSHDYQIETWQSYFRWRGVSDSQFKSMDETPVVRGLRSSVTE